MNELKSNPIKTVLTITVGFLVIFAITKLNWTLWIALGVGFSGVFSEALSRLIEIAWIKLAKLLSYIAPNILMGVIFFCCLLPIALLSKLFRKTDIMHLKNNSNSVFIDKSIVYDKTHFENMW